MLTAGGPVQFVVIYGPLELKNPFPSSSNKIIERSKKNPSMAKRGDLSISVLAKNSYSCKRISILKAIGESLDVFLHSLDFVFRSQDVVKK